MERSGQDVTAPGEPEATVSSQRVYEGRILNLRVDTVRLPSGRLTTREIVEHRGSVAMVPLDADGNVLLVRQFRKPLERFTLEIPAGTRELGEDILACVQRELREETGYCAERVERLGGYYSAAGYCTEYLDLYLAQDIRPDPLAPEEESIAVVKMPLKRALGLVAAGEICDAKSIIGLLLVEAGKGL